MTFPRAPACATYGSDTSFCSPHASECDYNRSILGKDPIELPPYRGLFPSPPLFDRMPTYRTQGKRSLNFLSATRSVITRLSDGEIEQHWQGMRADIESLGVERFPRLSAALAEQGPQMEEMFARMVEVAIEGVAAVYGVE